MKRSQGKQSIKSAPRALDARRLRGVRGGDLGISVVIPPPAPELMQMQHNETLVRL